MRLSWGAPSADGSTNMSMNSRLRLKSLNVLKHGARLCTLKQEPGRVHRHIQEWIVLQSDLGCSHVPLVPQSSFNMICHQLSRMCGQDHPRPHGAGLPYIVHPFHSTASAGPPPCRSHRHLGSIGLPGSRSPHRVAVGPWGLHSPVRSTSVATLLSWSPPLS